MQKNESGGVPCARELCYGNTDRTSSEACHADRLTLGRLDSGFRRKERKNFEAVFQATNVAGHGLQKKIPQEREFSLCSRVPAFSSIAMAQKKGALISQRSRKLATTYSSTPDAVPSARAGLTSLFGMGRGGSPLLLSP